MAKKKVKNTLPSAGPSLATLARRSVANRTPLGVLTGAYSPDDEDVRMALRGPVPLPAGGFAKVIGSTGARTVAGPPAPVKKVYGPPVPANLVHPSPTAATKPKAPPVTSNAAPAPSSTGTATLSVTPAPTATKKTTTPKPTSTSTTTDTTTTPAPSPGYNGPTVDINSLFAPAERAIASQRAAALAAQNKAFQDNMAFEQFVQDATGKANAALAPAVQGLSAGAAQSRQASMDNLTAAIAAMKGQAGGSADLARLSGSDAAQQGANLLQSGQAALNSVPDVVGEAALNYAGAQGQIGAAQGRLMNDAAIRATQAALGDAADKVTSLETSKASAALQDVANQRDYIIQQGQLQALQDFNSGKLSEQHYATQSKLYADLAKVKTTEDVARIKAATAKEVEAGRMTRADAANANKLAVEQLRQTGQTNRTLLGIAAKNKVANTQFGSKAIDLVNSTLGGLTQKVESMNRYDRGQVVRQIAGQMKVKFVLGQAKPMTYQDARQVLSTIPKAGPEALKDPAFDAFLKTQFPMG